MKYLVLGVNGMAGHMIASYLVERGHSVTGFSKTKSLICESILGDARNTEDIECAINRYDYDVVVNCIGVLNREVDEDKVGGIYLNSVFPHLLAQLLKKKKTKLIHISTDCVFSGDKGSYKEDSITDATSMYGKSKALGEVMDHKNLTFRTSIVGPELNKNGIGLFHWFMTKEQSVKGYTSVIWTGVTTLQLAKAVEEAANQNITGLYHLVNNNTISKHDLLQLFNQSCKENTVEILEDDTVKSDKSLINTREDFNFSIPDYDSMVVEMKKWMNHHKNLYLHYS